MGFSVRRGVVGAALALIMGLPAGLMAQQGDMEETTRRRADEGGGPYERLVLRNVTVIDGTGAPPQGGVTIVIEGDRIVSVGGGRRGGQQEEQPDNTRVIDGTGMYVMPGFIDMHAHTGGAGKAPQAEYVYKLWMGHGVTTSRGVGHGGFEWSLQEKAAAARNEIVAPRMFSYVRPEIGRAHV